MPGVVAWLEPGLAAPPPFARRLGPRELMQNEGSRNSAHIAPPPFHG